MTALSATYHTLQPQQGPLVPTLVSGRFWLLHQGCDIQLGELTLRRAVIRMVGPGQARIAGRIGHEGQALSVRGSMDAQGYFKLVSRGVVRTSVCGITVVGELHLSGRPDTLSVWVVDARRSRLETDRVSAATLSTA